MVFERDGELHAALAKTDRGPNWLSNGLSLTIRWRHREEAGTAGVGLIAVCEYFA
jgi:hypothetical protein